MRPKQTAPLLLAALTATLLSAVALAGPIRAAPAIPKPAMAVSCGSISQNNWTIGLATHADGEGLKLSEVKYKGVQVAYLMTTPIVRVQYAGSHGLIRDDLKDAVFQSSPGCQKTNIGSTAFRVWTTYVFGSYPSCGSYKYEDT